MQRSYGNILKKHLHSHRQMLFLSGPRQVGKTTISMKISEEAPFHTYFNWDNEDHRALIIGGPSLVAKAAALDKLHPSLPILIFDEIHKYRNWKRFLKGFFDTYEKKCKILVTGSARLDIYKRGGDSLMGRYLLYRLHPFSLREIVNPLLLDHKEISPPIEIPDETFQALLQFGGFPEPFLKRDLAFFHNWKRLRTEQLVKEDVRDLSHIQETSQIQLLTEILKQYACQPLHYSILAGKIKASSPSVRRWIELLKNLYFCFTIPPFSTNLARSLIKEPKVYLWDWSLIDDRGALLENFTASHLYKAVQFWTDRGLGEYNLYYLRDKEKREVDFLVTKNKKPWFLVEVKTGNNKGISPSVYYFQKKLQVPHAFQMVFDLPYVEQDCFTSSSPIIVPARTLLSQLV